MNGGVSTGFDEFSVFSFGFNPCVRGWLGIIAAIVIVAMAPWLIR
jgi:hypothetical protein